MSDFHDRGFTLLELLISMTILAVIVVIMFGAFRVGIRAWEKGEKDLDLRQRERLVLDLIRRQLASVSTAEVRGGDGKPLLFRGDSKSLEFVSQVSLKPGSLPGPVYVKYAVGHETGDDKEYLYFYERSVALPGREADDPEPGEADFFELLAGVRSIVFEYLKVRPEEEESPWQESWKPALGMDIPRAVRILLQENEASDPLYVIAAAGR